MQHSASLLPFMVMRVPCKGFWQPLTLYFIHSSLLFSKKSNNTFSGSYLLGMNKGPAHAAFDQRERAASADDPVHVGSAEGEGLVVIVFQAMKGSEG